MTTGRWDIPAASTAPASTNLRCGSGRWCSRPPLHQFRLGWSSFQQSNLDLPHEEEWWGLGGGGTQEKRSENDKKWMHLPRELSLCRRGGGVMQRTGGSWGSQSRRTDLFTGMHRWACFCNTKALLLVSSSPSTWSALHPNAPRAEEPARRWLGSAERLECTKRGRGRERKLLWEGRGRVGVNHFTSIWKGHRTLYSFPFFQNHMHKLPRKWND